MSNNSSTQEGYLSILREDAVAGHAQKRETWRRYYFVLTDGRLAYYSSLASTTSENPLGGLQLSDTKIHLIENGDFSADNVFAVHACSMSPEGGAGVQGHAIGDTLVLSAELEGEVDSWVCGIMKASE